MQTGQGTSLLTAPAEPHPREFMTGTNHLISHHLYVSSRPNKSSGEVHVVPAPAAFLRLHL